MENPTLELRYRKAQRQLGEIDVAVRLISDLLRTHQDDQDLQSAYEAARRFRSAKFRQVGRIETALFGAPR